MRYLNLITILFISLLSFFNLTAQEESKGFLSKLGELDYEFQVASGVGWLGPGEKIMDQMKKDGFNDREGRFLGSDNNPTKSIGGGGGWGLNVFWNEQHGISISHGRLSSGRINGYDSIKPSSSVIVIFAPSYSYGNSIEILMIHEYTGLSYVYRTMDKRHYFEAGPILANQEIKVKMTGRKKFESQSFKTGIHVAYQRHLFKRRRRAFTTALKLSYNWFSSSTYGPYTAAFVDDGTVVNSTLEKVKAPSHSLDVRLVFSLKLFSGVDRNRK